MLEKIERALSLSKNIVLTIGIPVVLYLQTGLHQAEINSMQAKIDHLELLTFDKLPAILEGKDLIENEQKKLLKQRIQMLGGEFDFENLSSRYLCLKLNSNPDE